MYKRQAQAQIESLKIVTGFAAGGTSDTTCRRVAVRLTGSYAKSAVVENKTGAGGQIAIQYVKGQPADGATMLQSPTSMFTIYPHIFKKLPFDPAQDLQPVSAFVFAPMALVVKADAKFKTLAELVAAGKAEANKVTYGTGGAGSAPHFVSEALGIATGANFMHIPFKGAGEATLALLSGTIDFQFASTPGVMGNIKGGKVRLLAVSGAKRLPVVADVPTFAEAGVPNFGLVNFTGLWAPKGTPPAVVERLQKEVATAMASADMKAFAEGIASEPGHWDAATFAKDLAERTTYWGKVAANTAFERQ